MWNNARGEECRYTRNEEVQSVLQEEEYISSECALHSFFHVTNLLYIVALFWPSRPFVVNAAFK